MYFHLIAIDDLRALEQALQVCGGAHNCQTMISNLFCFCQSVVAATTTKLA